LLQHADLLDEYVGGWIAQHDLDEVLRKFEEAEAAVAPVYDIADIFRDPQYQALNSIITVPNEDLGPVKMQNVLFRLSETPGRIRWAGRRLGRDNAEVYGELGLTAEQLAELQAKGVI
ncbi:MAG: CoA transferase, partial [Chloroflexi bacterium]|nr:CoA transferase [Chloroflexota bacterium]